MADRKSKFWNSDSESSEESSSEEQVVVQATKKKQPKKVRFLKSNLTPRFEVFKIYKDEFFFQMILNF